MIKLVSRVLKRLSNKSIKWLILSLCAGREWSKDELTVFNILVKNSKPLDDQQKELIEGLIK